MKTKLIAILLLCTQTLWGAVAFVNTNTAYYNSGGSLSVSATVNATGSNRVAVVCITSFDNGTWSVSYGGQTMTSAGARSYNTLGTYIYEEMFYLVNPPTGSNTLAASVGSAVEIFATLSAFSGVNQTTPIRSGTYQSLNNQELDGSGYYSLVVQSNVNDLTVTCGDGNTSWPMASTNQTLDAYDTASGAGQIEQDHATTAAASVTHTWYNGGGAGENLTIIGFSLNGDLGQSTSAEMAGPYALEGPGSIQ